MYSGFSKRIVEKSQKQAMDTEYLMEENIWAQKNLGTIISLEVRGEVQGKTRYYISDEKEESA